MDLWVTRRASNGDLDSLSSTQRSLGRAPAMDRRAKPTESNANDFDHNDSENVHRRTKGKSRHPTQARIFDDETRPFLLPTRWWLASTAFPLLAGTFGPVANAFSICALSQHWRSESSNNGIIVTVKDPSWAVALNGVSLGFALISNLSLLLNMARRLPFPIAQPITVGGWYIASILLICLTAIFPRTADMKNRQVTQAYYYAIMAASLYFFISSLMLVTIYGARTHRYSRDFNLTRSQRSLMLQSIIYMFYLLLGALVYSYIEGWTYLDAVYWADFTILTDGIGDLAPKTHLGRGLLFPFAVGGILTLSLLITSVRSLMVERGRKKIIARTTERIRSTVAKRIRTGEKGAWLILPGALLDSNVSEERRKKEEFFLMRRIHQAAASYTRWYSLISALSAWLCLWFLGALAFYFAQAQTPWTYFESLYFAYTSLLTIGYGDFAPGKMWSRPFFVLWSLLAIPTTTILFTAIGDTLVQFFHDAAIYIGELTILPGEEGVKLRLRTTFQAISYYLRHPIHQILSQPTTHETLASKARSEHYALKLADLEKYKADPAQYELQRLYILSHELRKVHQDIGNSPPKRYTYEEWCLYLTLLERLGCCYSLVSIPPEETEVPGPRGLGPRAFRQEYRGKRWSWIGIHTPLMGEKDEAEWLFDAMSESLELSLRAQCDVSDSDALENTNSPD